MDTNRTRLLWRQGFTLTETLLSATLVAGALLTVVGLFSTSLGISRTSSKTTAASLLAKRVGEDLRSQLESSASSLATIPNLTLTSGENNPPLPVALFSSDLTPIDLASAGAATAELTTAQDEYINGFNKLEASHLATWFIKDREDIATGCKLLVVTIESPAANPAKLRKVWHYATLIHQSAAP